jgi:hypothetical protein
MAERKLQLLTATRNHQGVFDGINVNGMLYQLESGGHGWHMNVFPGKPPGNVYWVSGTRFYAAKIHLITEPANEIRLELFDEISFVPPEEKSAVLKAIAVWD